MANICGSGALFVLKTALSTNLPISRSTALKTRSERQVAYQQVALSTNLLASPKKAAKKALQNNINCSEKICPDQKILSR